MSTGAELDLTIDRVWLAFTAERQYLIGVFLTRTDAVRACGKQRSLIYSVPFNARVYQGGCSYLEFLNTPHEVAV